MNIYYVYIDNCITLLKFETFERNTYDNFETQESTAWEIFSSFFYFLASRDPMQTNMFSKIYKENIIEQTVSVFITFFTLLLKNLKD